MTNKTVILLLVGVLLANILGFLFFTGWDLTEDKRYSLSPATKSLLKELDEPVEVTVYLDGNQLPGGFERLKRAVNETLGQFSRYGRIKTTFVNPDAGSDETKSLLFRELTEKGMTPTQVFDQQGGRKSQIVIFPYATVKYNGKEDVVLLLKSNQSQAITAAEKLNQSSENVEYELASSIQKLADKNRKNIGLLTEFTSRPPLEFSSLVKAVSDRNNLYIIDAQKSPTFDGLDVLLVIKPDKVVDDSTKFKIDQFIMKGGRAMFFVDGLKVDSVGVEGSFAQPLDVNLDDLFFRYGLRINKNIVKDGLNAETIPLVVGHIGDRPDIQCVPYRYYPLINNFGPSLITKNIDMVLARNSATIDTVNNGDGLVKTPLLLTSPYTKILNAPALITYNEARTDTDEKEYQGGIKAIGYLVEGNFKSLFQSSFSGKNIVQESEHTKIVVLSNGEIIRNEANNQKGTFYPLGYSKCSEKQFGNIDFVLNALNYLADENGILVSKAKSINIRPLDALKTRNLRTKIQLLNVMAPLLLLLLFGAVRYMWIKKMYTK